jgi:adenine-specific DNA-methyltransferase
MFRLGILLDSIFGEENRLGIINWQKTTAKSSGKHVATATEYVLVYAKNEMLASTGLLDRSAKADARFGNRDKDPLRDWKQGDLAAAGDDDHPTMVYAIQSPFTGQIHYPQSGRHWAFESGSRSSTGAPRQGSVAQTLFWHEGHSQPDAETLPG